MPRSKPNFDGPAERKACAGSPAKEQQAENIRRSCACGARLTGQQKKSAIELLQARISVLKGTRQTRCVARSCFLRVHSVNARKASLAVRARCAAASSCATA